MIMFFSVFWRFHHYRTVGALEDGDCCSRTVRVLEDGNYCSGTVKVSVGGGNKFRRISWQFYSPGVSPESRKAEEAYR